MIGLEWNRSLLLIVIGLDSWFVMLIEISKGDESCRGWQILDERYNEAVNLGGGGSSAMWIVSELEDRR